MNPWRRVGLHYEAEGRIGDKSSYCLTVNSLGFISYHLIRLFHGEAKLIEMAPKGWNRYVGEAK